MQKGGILMIVEYSLDYWGVVFPTVLGIGVLGIVIVMLLTKESNAWYTITKRWRRKHGGLKYILYDPKRDIFICKNCKGFISLEQYKKTEQEQTECPTCGQRLMRIWFC